MSATLNKSSGIDCFASWSLTDFTFEPFGYFMIGCKAAQRMRIATDM